MALDHLVHHHTAKSHHRFFDDFDWKKAKRSKLAEIDEAAMCLVKLATSTKPTNNLSHTCSVCNKSFPSYQALGGHKASHRAKTTAAADHDVVTREDVVTNGVRVHKCNVCQRTFPTGQALGGHKRKHFEGVIGAKSRTSSSNKMAAAVVLDFDLNMPPPVEQGEDEEVESSLPTLFYG